MKDEVKKLESKIHSIVRNNEKEEQHIQSFKFIEEPIYSEIQEKVVRKDVLQCDLFSYQCEKKSTLQKHTNTKHGIKNNTSGIRNKFYSDECSSAFTTKNCIQHFKSFLIIFKFIPYRP